MTYKQGQIQMGEGSYKSFQIVQKCFHHNSHKANASYFIFYVVLFQYGNDGQLYLVGFHSKKFSMTKINYEIHNN
jgi:hypothetical protein